MRKSTKNTRSIATVRRRARAFFHTAVRTHSIHLECTCKTPLVRIASALGVNTTYKRNRKCPIHGDLAIMRRSR